MKIVFGLCVALCAQACDLNVLSRAECLQNSLAIYQVQPEKAFLYKAPIDAALEPLVIPEPVKEQYCGNVCDNPRLNAEMIWAQTNAQPIRMVYSEEWREPVESADGSGTVNGGDSSPIAHYASWQAPVQPCFGVCVSFSSQGATALKALTGKRIKSFQLIQGTVCADHPAQFGAGRIIQQANAMGIQTTTSKIGSAIVQQTVDTNWRKILMLSLNIGTGVALGVTTSGVVASSKAITTGIALGHLALDSLPSLLSAGAPNPDPFLSGVLDDNSKITIDAGACQSVLFSGVWNKNSPGVTTKVQLLP